MVPHKVVLEFTYIQRRSINILNSHNIHYCETKIHGLLLTQRIKDGKDDLNTDNAIIHLILSNMFRGRIADLYI